MADQETIDRVVAAIESADVGCGKALLILVDGIHTYELEMQGVVSLSVDDDEADATEQLYAHVPRVKQSLAPTPSSSLDARIATPRAAEGEK